MKRHKNLKTQIVNQNPNSQYLKILEKNPDTFPTEKSTTFPVIPKGVLMVGDPANITWKISTDPQNKFF